MFRVCSILKSSHLVCQFLAFFFSMNSSIPWGLFFTLAGSPRTINLLLYQLCHLLLLICDLWPPGILLTYLCWQNILSSKIIHSERPKKDPIMSCNEIHHLRCPSSIFVRFVFCSQILLNGQKFQVYSKWISNSIGSSAIFVRSEAPLDFMICRFKQI